jgi:hypothetical protein
MHVFTRYIATYIVVPAGLIGAFAMGTAVNAEAEPAHNDWQPSIVATPTVKARTAAGPSTAGPGTSHSTRRHQQLIQNTYR